MPRILGNFGHETQQKRLKMDWADVENYGVQQLEPQLEALTLW